MASSDDTTILKQCSRKEKCVSPLGSWMPATVEYFTIRKDRASGLGSHCKYCHAQSSREYKVDHAEAVRDSRAAYREANREILREKSRIYAQEMRKTDPERRRNTNRKWRSKNIEHERKRGRDYRKAHPEKSRTWNAANPDKAKSSCKKWHASNPEYVRASNHRYRARKEALGDIFTTADVRLQIKAQTDRRGRLRCWWCGKVIHGNDYHVDHRIPLAKGGRNNADNIVIAHPFCNLSKSDKTPAEFAGRLF